MSLTIAWYIDILEQATVPAKTITTDNCVPAFDACKVKIKRLSSS